MRTQEEIKSKIEEEQSSPENLLFNFAFEVFLPYLDFERAKPFLKPDCNQEEWDKIRPPYVLGAAQVYMQDYGWPKCQNHRGLSAVRTIQKMKAWAWLAGDDQLVATIAHMQETNYAQYGAPVLQAICQYYNWPIPEDEPTLRMMRGEWCNPNCTRGCGQ